MKTYFIRGRIVEMHQRSKTSKHSEDTKIVMIFPKMNQKQFEKIIYGVNYGIEAYLGVRCIEPSEVKREEREEARKKK